MMSDQETNTGPIISIGFPVYNAECFVEKALDSLLGQTYANIEINISDNASTDRTTEICKRYAENDPRIRYFCNESNIGPLRNFHKVVDYSRGKYTMWAAADDWWAPDFVKALVNELETHPKAGLAMTALERRYLSKDTTRQEIRFAGKANPNNMNYLQMADAMLVKPHYHFFIYGLYKTEFLKALIRNPLPEVPSFDRLFMAQAALSAPVRYVDQVLHIRYVHDEPLEDRYKDEIFMQIHRSSNLAMSQTLLAIEPYLLASESIPEPRKQHIALMIDSFVTDNAMLLFINEVKDENDSCNVKISKPDEDDIHIFQFLMQTGMDRAAHLFATALAVEHPNNLDTLILLSEIKLKMNHWFAAKNIFQFVLKRVPDHTFALQQLAIILWREGKHSEAIEAGEKAVQSDTMAAEPRGVLGAMYLQKNDHESCFRIMEPILDSGHSNSDIFKVAGVCCFHLNNLPRARELLEKGLMLAPKDKEINTWLRKIPNMATA